MAGPKKTFTVGNFLKSKTSSTDTSSSNEAAFDEDVRPSAAPISNSRYAADEHGELQLVIAADLSHEDQTQTGALAFEVSSARHEVGQKKKPGPKRRGLYAKRTIGIAKDLDDFVEHARRSHVRPDGTSSTIYGHFIEDLIAAERQRRATR